MTRLAQRMKWMRNSHYNLPPHTPHPHKPRIRWLHRILLIPLTERHLTPDTATRDQFHHRMSIQRFVRHIRIRSLSMDTNNHYQCT